MRALIRFQAGGHLGRLTALPLRWETGDVEVCQAADFHLFHNRLITIAVIDVPVAPLSRSDLALGS